MATHCPRGFVLGVVMVNTGACAFWRGAQMSAARVEVGQLAIGEVFPFSVDVPLSNDSNFCRMRSRLREQATEMLVKVIIARMPTAWTNDAVVPISFRAWEDYVTRVSNVQSCDAEIGTSFTVIEH